MKDEFGNEIESDEFGNPVVHEAPAPPTGPLTAAERAQPTITAGQPEQEMGAGEGALRSIRKVVNGAMFGLLPQASAAIDASTPDVSRPLPGKDWMDRYKQRRDYYQQGLDEDSKKLAHPNLLELAGGLTTGGALAKVLPTASAAVRQAPRLLRAALGVGEASALNAGVGAAKEWDDPTKAAAAAKEGATSPWNLVGAVGPMVEALAPLFGRASLSRATRSVPPTSGEMEVLRQTFHSPDEVAKFLRDTKLQNGTRLLEPGDTPELINNKLKMLKDSIGEDKKKFVDLADQLGAKVDLDGTMQKIMDVFKGTNTPGTRVTAPRAVDNVAKVIGRIMDEAGYKGPGVAPYNPKITKFSDWEGLKTKIQQAVSDRIASGRVSTPVQSALGQISSIIKTADEEALGRVWGPDMVESFVNTKDQYGRASALSDVARRAANSSAAAGPESSTGKRVLTAALSGLGAGAYSHDPRIGGAAAVAAAAGSEAASAFDKANPRMTRTYDWLRRKLPEEVDSSTAPYATILRQALGGAK